MTCRTAEEAFAAGQQAGQDDPPLTQEQADLAHALVRPAIGKAA